MNRDEVNAIITEVLEDLLDIENLTITDATTAADVPGWDSITHIRILASLESRFKMRFTNAELDKLKSIGDLITAVIAKQKK